MKGEDIREKIKKAKNNQKESTGFFFAAWFISLLVEILFYRAIYAIGHLGQRFDTGFFPMIKQLVIGKPMLFVFMLLLGGVFAYLVSNRKWHMEERVTEEGIKMSRNPILGSAEKMGKAEKQATFDMREIHDPKGVILGIDKKTKKLLTLPDKPKDPDMAPTNGNILVVGKTGSRKSTGVLLPNIYSCIERGYSMVITDPKGEIYKETVAAAKEFGYETKIFSLVGGHFDSSDGWDFLKLIRESDSPEEIADIATDQILMNIGSSGEETFWTDENRNLLKLVLLTVAKAEEYKPITLPNTKGETRTFQEALALLGKSNLETLLEGYVSLSDNNRDLLEGLFTTWTSHSQQKDAIRSGLSSKLGIINNKRLRKILSEDEIDFHELCDKKEIIYVIASDKERTYKSILALFSAMLFREATDYADSKPNQRLDHPLYFFFEEFRNVGYIPDLAVKIATIRSRRINMVFCYQNIAQIKDTYSKAIDGKNEWQTILSACATQVCCGSNDDDTNKYFSERSGDMTIEAVSEALKVSSIVPDDMKFAPYETVRRDAKNRKAFLTTDIKMIKPSEILLSLDGHNSTLEDKYYYQDHPLYQYQTVDENGNRIAVSPYNHIPLWRQKEEGLKDAVIRWKKFEGMHKEDHFDEGNDSDKGRFSKFFEEESPQVNEKPREIKLDGFKKEPLVEEEPIGSVDFETGEILEDTVNEEVIIDEDIYNYPW